MLKQKLDVEAFDASNEKVKNSRLTRRPWSQVRGVILFGFGVTDPGGPPSSWWSVQSARGNVAQEMSSAYDFEHTEDIWNQ